MVKHSRKLIWVGVMCAAVVMVGVRPALAQDERTVGLVMAFPSEVGVLWQVSDRIAVRPDVSFTWVKHNSSSSVSFDDVDYGRYESESSSHSLGAGVSVLVTVARWERLRAYVVPRVSYTRISGNIQTTAAAPSAVVGGIVTAGIIIADEQEDDQAAGRAVEASGAFGVEYSLGERFGVYGEAGLSYASIKNPPFRSSDESSTRAVGSRSNIGIIFRF